MLDDPVLDTENDKESQKMDQNKWIKKAAEVGIEIIAVNLNARRRAVSRPCWHFVVECIVTRFHHLIGHFLCPLLPRVSLFLFFAYCYTKPCHFQKK